MKRIRPLLLVTSLLAMLHAAAEDVPAIIPYQGWVQVNGMNFTGPGKFKFALVDSTGNTVYWRQDGSAPLVVEPNTSVTVAVTDGLFTVPLGDPAVAGMAPLPPTTFEKQDVRLVIWFDDGRNGFVQLGAPRRLLSTPYAVRSHSSATLGADTTSSVTITGSIAVAKAVTLPNSSTGSAAPAAGSIRHNNAGGAGNEYLEFWTGSARIPVNSYAP